MIDLHTHSTCSDGQLSPNALAALAIERDLHLFALTDHDTVDGIAAAQQACLGSKTRCIPGIELSVRWKKCDLHILGLNIDAQYPVLLSLIQRQKDCRIARAQEIAKQLLRIGVENAYERACQLAQDGVVTRPHFARLLIEDGLADSMQQAFSRYLVRGRIAYVPTVWATLEEVVTVIKDAGGKAAIAHPLKYKLTTTKLKELIREFKQFGGDALEVISGFIPYQAMIPLMHLCQQFDLQASSGSDYHGEEGNAISLGRQMRLPEGCVPVWHDWILE